MKNATATALGNAAQKLEELSAILSEQSKVVGEITYALTNLYGTDEQDIAKSLIPLLNEVDRGIYGVAMVNIQKILEEMDFPFLQEANPGND